MSSSQRIDALVARMQASARHSEDVYCNFAGTSTEQAIASVEQALGVRISGSFRDFMLKTGGGGLDTFSISAIPEAAPLGGLGTVHGDTLHYRQGFWASPLPPHLVVIQRDLDDNEPFCLDTSRTVAGENPVVLFYPASRNGHVDRIAPSFIDFLDKHLGPRLDDLDEEDAP